MKTLQLTLKKQWFDMILSGVKKEEYREIKKHWIRQLVTNRYSRDDWKCEGQIINIIKVNADHYAKNRIKEFDIIEFRHGYAQYARSFKIEFKGIEIRQGNTDWGAEPGKIYFVIKLGQLLNKETEYTELKNLPWAAKFTLKTGGIIMVKSALMEGDKIGCYKYPLRVNDTGKYFNKNKKVIPCHT